MGKELMSHWLEGDGIFISHAAPFPLGGSYLQSHTLISMCGKMERTLKLFFPASCSSRNSFHSSPDRCSHSICVYPEAPSLLPRHHMLRALLQCCWWEMLPSPPLSQCLLLLRARTVHARAHLFGCLSYVPGGQGPVLSCSPGLAHWRSSVFIC